MFKRNSGSNEHDILQNQFTSYLSFAVSHARIDFIRAKTERLKREQVTDRNELIFAEESFDIEAFLENEILMQAMSSFLLFSICATYCTLSYSEMEDAMCEMMDKDMA